MSWKTLEKSGLEPTAPTRLADGKLRFIDSASIGNPAPKIHQWTIYFCRWGFGWVDKAQCFPSARRFGAVGSSPNFSRVFHDIWLPGI